MSVLLWTRRPYDPRTPRKILRAEIAEDAAFHRVVATAKAPISKESDWTCRVLVGGLKPSTAYWYRFADPQGNGSRIGRTITAPAEDDGRPVRFAFVSCQNANQGAQNAYRRMIFEDERAPEENRLGFVLHLGDFIYEIVWYPQDRPQGMYDRRLRDIVSSGYSAKVVEEANRRYPGQPIKAVITTSDAWPHLSGIREYVAAGIPIYALDLNQAILERVIRSPHTTKPDKLQRSPRDPIFHLVSGKTIITSAVNPLEIYPIRAKRRSDSCWFIFRNSISYMAATPSSAIRTELTISRRQFRN